MAFEDAVRNYLELKPEDYYWEEYNSGLDHHEPDQLSTLCWAFYHAGKADAEKKYRGTSHLAALFFDDTDKQSYKELCQQLLKQIRENE